jgi:hypothetical protein
VSSHDAAGRPIARGPSRRIARKSRPVRDAVSETPARNENVGVAGQMNSRSRSNTMPPTISTKSTAK